MSSGREPSGRPGETGFIVLLVVFSAVALWQSSLISDFEGPVARRYAAPGVFPLLASGVMLLSALVVLFKAWQRGAGSGRGRFRVDVAPLRLVIMTALIGGYVALMPVLGFLADSALFLFASFVYLWQRPWWQCLLVTGLALGLVWLIFRVLFQVVLPLGHVDRWLVNLF